MPSSSPDPITLQDGLCGNMADVLEFLITREKSNCLIRPHTLPGFLLSPEDQKEINSYLSQPSKARSGKTSFEALFNQLPA